MKTLKTLVLLAVFVVLGMVRYKIVHAADEASKVVNFIGSEMGVVYTSTGPLRTFESRRINTNQLGEVQTVNEGLREVALSTGPNPNGQWCNQGSSNTFTVIASSWPNPNNLFMNPFGMVCRGLQDNCNVYRLATSSNPVYVDHVAWGDVVGAVNGITQGPGRTTVRLFDSRGSTAIADGQMFFQQSQSSGAVSNVGYWCSSGVTMMVDTPSKIFLYLGKQFK